MRIEQKIDPTRQSSIRKYVSRPVEIATNYLADRKIDPDWLSTANLVGTTAASVLHVNGYRKTALAVGAISSILDAVDGPLARKLDARGLRKLKQNGNQVDGGADAIGEIVSNLAVAHTSESKIGQTIGVLAATTSSFARKARLIAEQKGINVGEGGDSLMNIAGSRVGRVTLTAIAAVHPKVQPFAQGVQVAANLRMAYKRMQLANVLEPTLNQTIIDKAERMDNLYTLANIGAIGLSAAYLAREYLKK